MVDNYRIPRPAQATLAPAPIPAEVQRAIQRIPELLGKAVQVHLSGVGNDLHLTVHIHIHL
jgi:hypothetical protein